MRAGAFAFAMVFTLACGSSDSAPSAPDPPTADAGISDASGEAVDAGRSGNGAQDAGVPVRDFGTTFSPVGFGGPVEGWLGNRAAFYEARQKHGRVVAFHFGWRDPGATRPPCGAAPGIEQLLDVDLASNTFSLSIVLGWSAGDGAPDLGCEPTASDNSWANPTTRAKYKEVAVALATRYRPPYLYLGNEVNTWYLKHPSEWSDWVSELDDVARAVHAASPATIVGTIYQWEHLRGGGAKNGWTDPPQWSLIDDVVGKVDLLGITTYPYFDYDTPAAVPANYYDELLARFPGPVGVTEIGWRAEPGAPYPGSATDQAAWPAAMVAKIPASRLRYASWVFLNDPLGDTGPFSTAGLRDTSGTPRAVDAAWQAVVLAHQSP